MSDTDKPGREHDDAHGHAEDSTNAHVEHHPAEPGHDSAGHSTDATDHADAGVILPVAEPVSDTHSDEQVVADTPVTEAHEVAHDHHHEPADTHPPVDPAPVAALAAVVTSDTHKPIWSDHGDAPFDGGDEKPVKVRDTGDKGGAGSETLEIIKTIFFALLIALVLRVLLFQPFTIPSASMEPNLYEGDYIVVSKWTYGYSRHSIPFSPPLFEGRIMGSAPERGDIVVFKLPRDNKTDYIKRVIGLPGDQIQMIGNRLHINGAPVDDVVVSRGEIADLFGPRSVTTIRQTLPGGASFMTQDFGPGGDLDDTAVYEVPVGHYFMMGDNRDNSIDSRVDQANGVGLVPAENLIGKAEIIMFSWEPGASLLNPISWFANVRLSRFFKVLN